MHIYENALYIADSQWMAKMWCWIQGTAEKIYKVLGERHWMRNNRKSLAMKTQYYKLNQWTYWLHIYHM